MNFHYLDNVKINLKELIINDENILKLIEELKL